MSSPNDVFAIAFGPYDLRVDRRRLTVSLRETGSGTLWADGLSIGWIDLAPHGRVDFGACRLVSLSEKMGAAGKRILFGLEAPGGVPVDLYFTCGPREIQLTVEASRDTRDARVEAVGLLPGLVSAGSDGALVLPCGEGALLRGDAPPGEAALSPWDGGLWGAFVGAVRPGSALCVPTDSAYAAARVAATGATVSASWEYARDPERRRLDLRVIPIPGGDPVAVARAYRDRLVAERAHVTLRQKSRERPDAVAAVVGGPVAPGDPVAAPPDPRSRWEAIDQVQDALKAAAQDPDRALHAALHGDWAGAWVDLWTGRITLPDALAGRFPGAVRAVPLIATVWRDAVSSPVRVDDQSSFRTALRHLAPPEAGSAEPWASVLAALHRESFAAFLTGHRRVGDVEELSYSNRWTVRTTPDGYAVTGPNGEGIASG